MKNKSKHNKRIAISIISIISMLTFSLSNSMFIHEANSHGELASNISNEYDAKLIQNHDIGKYTIERSNLGDNDVTYYVNYNEDGVWYWNQQKEDYVKKSWTQYAYDQWYYGPKVDLGDSGDDNWHSGQSSYAPSFTIKYTGSRPTHEVHHPAIEDDPDTPWDESVPAWDETVEDDWPNPVTAFKDSISNWDLQGSWSPNSNQEYTFRWDQYNSKMSSFPKLQKNWKYVNQNSGEWNQSTYNHWNWSGTDYWKNPSRASTGMGNKSIYVDWTLETNDVILESGRQNIYTHDIITQTADSFASSNPKATYTATDSQKHSSTPPSVTMPEPNESDWFGVEGETYIRIDNLPLGWEYNFDAELKYVDKDGNEQVYDTFADTFSTEKTLQGDVDSWYESNSEGTIKFGYDIEDPKNLRASDVYWTVSTSKGIIDSGVSQSNHFEQTFYIGDETEADFEFYYDYALSNDINGQPNLTRSATNTVRGSTDVFYEDEIESFDIWFDNIQDDSFIFNYYLSTNNNFISDDSSIVVSTPSKTYTISDVKPGTTSYLIKFSEYPELDNISDTEVTAEVTSPGMESKVATNNLNTETNLVKDFSMQIIDNEYINNTEAGINYTIDSSGLKEDVNYIRYNLNGEWYDLDYENTSSIQMLELNNLKEQYEYNIYFEANTDTRDYYSNNFKFKTDRNTRIYLDENNISVGENSASMTFNVDKEEYLDQKEFKWNIIDLEDDTVLYEVDDVIQGNGYKTIYADGLKANHEYRFVINVVIEGRVVMLYSDLTTNLSKNDTVNNSFIDSITKTKKGFEMDYRGRVSSIQYSIDGETWNDTTFEINDDNKIVVNGLNTNSEGYISFRINNQMRSQTTYYEGVESTLIKPKNDIDEDKLVFWILITFIILTAITSTVLGVFYVKRSKSVKVEGNIWTS